MCCALLFQANDLPWHSPGYALTEVLGRNCRFLQGPGTDPTHVELIRNGVKEGKDTAVCLVNYKKDGTPFLNAFFMAPLRDAQGNIVNFVGVQCDAAGPE